LAERGLDGEVLWGTKSLYRGVNDIQALPLFPVLEDLDRVPALVAWLLGVGSSVVQAAGRSYWLKGRRVSADDLMAKANLPRLFAQRKVFMQENLKGLKANGSKSVFYQLDLEHVAKLWVASGHALEPKAFVADALDFKEMQEWMFRSRVKELQGLPYKEEELMAFRLLRNRFLKLAVQDKVCPKRSVFPDQIVWGRSPIRVELAGGWTDTPPYSVVNGGKVVNVSFRLNGQDPLQVYVRRTDALTITLRSIDLGTSEVIRDWERLALYDRIGNEFSITKAALSICGFSPDFCRVRYVSLEKQLAAFGGGLEVSTFAAIPKGSGLGTSSILSATILSAVADFCGLGWSRKTVCEKALVLEQMLTSGGGWQDQYGGAMAGVKLLESEPGIGQEIYVKWGPERLFKAPESKDRMLLYYTGITRVAKHILGNIVKSMFLNEKKNLAVLEAMKGHAEHTFGAIQRGDLEALAADVNRSWEMYKQLDAGTNPPAVAALIERIAEACSCCKLCGAGGGGYLFIIAKDRDAAVRIREELTQNPPNENARFVSLDLSEEGLVVTRS